MAGVSDMDGQNCFDPAADMACLLRGAKINTQNIMGKLAKFINDKEWNDLHRQLAEMQVKEMKDQKWYPKEIERLKEKIKARGDYLRDNCS